jgi:hypothetical protein
LKVFTKSQNYQNIRVNNSLFLQIQYIPDVKKTKLDFNILIARWTDFFKHGFIPIQPAQRIFIYGLENEYDTISFV